MCVDTLVKYWLKLLLTYSLLYLKTKSILRCASVYKTEILWDYLIKEHLTKGGIYNTCNLLSFIFYCPSHMNLAVKSDNFILIRKNCFILGLEVFALTNLTIFIQGKIIYTKYHIL